MKSVKVVLGVITGAVVGAAAGILLAPTQGWKTRKRLLKKGESYVDSLKDKFDELRDAVTDKIEKAKDDVADYAETKISQPQRVDENPKKAKM